MIFFFLFGFVALLVCGGAVVGFVLALYAFRPGRLADLLEEQDREDRSNFVALTGLLLAVAIPALAGVSYAVSGTKLFVELFGVAGTYFWVWVGAAFVVGFVLALLLRSEPRK